MPKFRVHGVVAAGKYMGEYEATSPEEAAQMAYDNEGHVNLCHQCADEADDAQVVSVVVIDADGNEVWTDRCD